jgi:hypothetical protein
MFLFDCLGAITLCGNVVVLLTDNLHKNPSVAGGFALHGSVGWDYELCVGADSIDGLVDGRVCGSRSVGGLSSGREILKGVIQLRQTALLVATARPVRNDKRRKKFMLGRAVDNECCGR